MTRAEPDQVRVETTVRGGLTIHYRPGTLDLCIFDAIHGQDEYRLGSIRFNPGDIVLDIGGHIGFFALAVLLKGVGHVHVYEISEQKIALCRCNLAPYMDRVSIHRRAVWAESGRLLGLGPFPYHDGCLNTGGIVPGDTESCSSAVETIAFDQVVDELSEGGRRQLALVKMDAEGSDWPILAASKTLNRIDRLVGEFHEFGGRYDSLSPSALGLDDRHDCTRRALSRTLGRAGFRIALQERDSRYGMFFASRHPPRSTRPEARSASSQQKDTARQPDPRRFLFLAACAQIDHGPEGLEAVACRAAGFTDWDWLPGLVKKHGLGPLVLRAASKAGIVLPTDVKRHLIGLVLHTREIHRVQFTTLRQILETYAERGIQATLLKGSALVHLLYPEPGLRPMSDMDLFIPIERILEAQAILADMGFHAPGRAMLVPGPIKHLYPATKIVDGRQVIVELHCRLAHRDMNDLVAWPGLTLDLDGLAARTLSATAMFIHLAHHFQNHLRHFDAWKLLWLADILGWARKYNAHIDWAAVRRRFPETRNFLTHVRLLSPATIPGLDIPSVRVPRDLGTQYQGWPVTTMNQALGQTLGQTLAQAQGQSRSKAASLARLTRDTFLAPDWALRFHYGLSPAPSALVFPRLVHVIRLIRRLWPVPRRLLAVRRMIRAGERLSRPLEPAP